MTESSTPQFRARTPLLRALQQAFGLAVAANTPGAPSAEELADMATSQSRRDFLTNTAKMGLLVGATGLLASCEADVVEPAAPSSQRSLDGKGPQPSVVVVGAGLAGLNCAYQLKKAGLRATVYEASSRAGGRIFTARDLMAPGLTTELGGEFIDSGHRDMLQLAQEFGLALYDVEAPSETVLKKDAYFFGGKQYTVAEVIAAFQPYARQIEADIRTLPGTITFDNLTPAAARFDQLSIAAYFDSIGLTGLVRELLDVAYLTEYGREVNDQSSINFLWLFSADTHKGSFDIFGISDERYKIQGGNQQLTDALAQQLSGQITLQHKLVTLARNAANQYVLTFEQASGQRLTVAADYVVLTLPFTLLRKVNIQVALPTWKTNAIQNLGYGTNAKLFLGFNGRPWRANGYTGYIFSDLPVQSGWDSGQLQPTTNSAYTVYLGGQEGLRVGSGSAQAQVSRYLPVLEAAWPAARGQYNGRAERMHWPTHPHTLASYACFRPGQYSTIAGAEGRPVDNLFFAGEHCSAWYQGYMNGAAETGRVAAEGIQAALRSGSTALHRRLRQREASLA
ncbi:FAD-dependent oxidoreductase [Hymenobacter sp. HSC-4F20]|uniref:flavin monoamine oxidase family protein n=1 Tax=Hymenobacter sp. HSC-4F20 TaxID=2864135 RepID=UPI001C737430|nr:NAD(P)/FAD-dependent oxidoreductase [Hymenobacter sp. HSC-4F20]MBX0289099.1 FAD-dependent oxidoreductase [Hymenobacter sp. HSC-4F20]